MKAGRLALLVGIVALAAFVAYLALRNPQPPVLPDDITHAAFVDAPTCLACHGNGGMSPRSKQHPVARDCLRCHGTRS